MRASNSRWSISPFSPGLSGFGRRFHSFRLPPPASRLRPPGKLLKPMLDNDEPVRRIRFEPANHQEPFVVETNRVLCAVLVRLERGRGKESGSPSHRESRRRRQRYCSEVSDLVTIEKLVPLVRPLRLRPSSRRY